LKERIIEVYRYRGNLHLFSGDLAPQYGTKQQENFFCEMASKTPFFSVKWRVNVGQMAKMVV